MAERLPDGPAAAVDRPASGRTSEVIVIASGKGGVGKSNLALNAGIHLARTGVDTILLDADHGLANIDLMVNAAPRGAVTRAVMRARLDELLQPGPHGLRIARSPNGPAARDYVCLARRLAGACQRVLVDCGAGLAPLVTTLALSADRLVLVTTPEPPAVTDAYATLKLLVARGLRGPVGLVVNQATADAAARTHARLSHTARTFLGVTVADYGYVPADAAVVRAVGARRPVAVAAPGCPADRAFRSVATHLGARPADRSWSAAWWQRLARLFL